MANVDIDRLIDWNAFYGQYVGTYSPAGEHKMHACCPFHQESNPSFWWNTQNGCFKCEAGCGQGNATTFLARIKGIETKDAFKELCRLAGVDPQDARPEARTYTLKEYALEKRLPADFLTGLGVRDGYRGRCVEIPYLDESGKRTALRKRWPPNAEKRFTWGKGSRIGFYGLWRMEEIRSAGYVILVEGESDTQTLWYAGKAALGVPGANAFNGSYAAKLLDIPVIYLHEEPDRAARQGRARIARALMAAGYAGELRVWRCQDAGAKDPSLLWQKEGREGFGKALRQLLEGARNIDLEQAALTDMEELPQPPILLRTPQEYVVRANGIYKYSRSDGQLEPQPFTWTPLLITRVLMGAAGDLKSEIAYLRGGRWHMATYPRRVLASAQEIVTLAERGIDVTSENRSEVVRYLSTLERENTDRIPEVRRITHCGWIDRDAFYPGAAPDVVLDTSDGSGRYARIGQASGNAQAWAGQMGALRGNSIFRFILAAAFAPPLLKILRQRIFVLYNWGDSKGGKTAAMLCALSAWGDPDSMRISFDATKTAIEETAGFFTDVPFGINERQLAGGKQEFVENIIYMLSEGAGRARGKRGGGLRETTTWRGVMLANGEESLTVGSTQTGVSTRALEVYGKPFDDKATASAMYAFVAQHHGHAGPAFVRRLIETDDETLQRLYDDFRRQLRGTAEAGDSHLDSACVVAVADCLAGQWIFGETPEAARAGALGATRDILAGMQSTEESDVNERAYAFIVDWVLSNRPQFTQNYRPPRYGMFERKETSLGGDEEDTRHVLVFPSILEKALSERGYSYQKTLRWMAENGKLETAIEGGRLRFAVKRWMDGVRNRFIRIALPGGFDLADLTTVQDDELPF